MSGSFNFLRRHPLILVQWLRLKRGFLQRCKQLSSIRGIFLLLVVLGFLMIAVSITLDHGLYNSVSRKMESWSQSSLQLAFGLLIGCVATGLLSHGPPLHFNEAEEYMLLSAPISRSNLILLKFSGYFLGACLSAALLVLVLSPIDMSILVTFISTLLVLILVQLLSTVLRQFFGIFFKKYSAQKYTMVLVLVLLVFLAWNGVYIKHELLGVPNYIFQFLGYVIVLPFLPAAELFVTTKDKYIYPMIFILIVQNYVLVRSVIYLDGLERSADKKYAKRTEVLNDQKNDSSMFSSISLGLLGTTVSIRSSVYSLVTVQLVLAIRSAWKTIVISSLLSLSMGCYLYYYNLNSSLFELIPLGFFIGVFILPRSMPVGFKNSINKINETKSFPVEGWKICLGLTLVPVLLTSVIEWMFVIPVSLRLDFNVLQILGTVCLVVLFNLILYLSEGLLSLYFPSKLSPLGRLDFDFLGRTLFEFAVKSIVLLSTVVITLLILNYLGKLELLNVFSLVSVGLGIPISICVVFLALMSKAYRRFEYTGT